MAMIDTGRQFDSTTMELLSSCRGHALESFEAYLPFGDDEHLYKTARLHFDDLALDVSNVHEPIVVGPDYAEEPFAIMSLSPASAHELWRPAGKELRTVELGFPVHDVLVVIDTALLSKGSRRLNRLKLVQAILFENETGELVAFDRDIWSDEYLAARRGTSVSTTTRDFRADFVAEPPYSYAFGRDIVRLSNPHAHA